MTGNGDKRAVLAPTLACGDRLNLEEQLVTLTQLKAPVLHLDVMDGHYVPNLCFDMDTIRQIRSVYPFMLEVHLMVSNPEDYITPLHMAGVECLSVHVDACSDVAELLRRIEDCGMKGGIALNPSQPVRCLEAVLPQLSHVLVMGVNPGFSGQVFIPETVDKIRELWEIREEKGLDFQIEVDGGIDDEAIRVCVKQGADILVSGAFGAFRGEEGLHRDYLRCLMLVRQAEKCEKRRGKFEENTDID